MEKVILKNIHEQSYAMKESLRALRTNLQFCGDDVKVVLLTSTMPDEGKSTVAVNLARSLAEGRKKVLLVDTDMRKSVMVGRLRAGRERGGAILGLSHYLSGQRTLEEVIYSTDVPRLFMIFAGPSVPNPTEILEKQYFETLIKTARNVFDYVLIDCAPLGAAIDAAVIARQCDGAIMVIAQGQAGRQAIHASVRQLEASGVRILGAVLNKVKMKKNGYGKYYGKYYGSYYGAYEKEARKEKENHEED